MSSHWLRYVGSCFDAALCNPMFFWGLSIVFERLMFEQHVGRQIGQPVGNKGGKRLSCDHVYPCVLTYTMTYEPIWYAAMAAPLKHRDENFFMSGSCPCGSLGRLLR